MLKDSHCDRSLSVRTSVNSCLKKHHLLWNYVAKFIETSQEASLGVPLKENKNEWSWLISNNNNNKMAYFLFCFKKHLLWNYQFKFKETLQEASLGEPQQKYNKGSRLIINNNNNSNNNKMADFLFCFKNISWNYQSKLNEALQEASLGEPLQKYNKGHNWSTTTTTIWPTSCFTLNKHLLWNYQAGFTETPLHDSLAYTSRPLFVICWSWLECLWNIHCVKMCLNCIFINALSQSCGPLLRWAF